MHSSDVVLQTHSSRCFKIQIKFLCSWTCSIRIFMNSTLILDPVHLNKLFSITNWLFLIPCYCQNSIGDLWNTLCSNIGNSSIPINNVWFVDGHRHNLLSISKFFDSGYDVMFDKRNCTVINKNDKYIVFKGKRKNDVY